MRLPGIIRACHPEPTATVTIVATLLAVSADRPLWETVLVAASVLCGQLSVGWSNDWIDAPRDVAAGRNDKPLVAGGLPRSVVGVAALSAAVAAAVLSLLLGPSGWLHIAAIASAWLYNHPLKKTVASVLPFAVSFGLLVAFAHPGASGLLVSAGVLLGSAAHFANVLPDLADDAATGVHGLPHRLGATGSTIAALLLLAAATVVTAFIGLGGFWLVAAVFVVVAVGFAAAVKPFRIVQLVALIDVVLLLLAANV